MHEAKSKLSQLVESALMGEEVIIAKSGKPAVRLVPCKPSKKRVFGKSGIDAKNRKTNTKVIEEYENLLKNNSKKER